MSPSMPPRPRRPLPPQFGRRRFIALAGATAGAPWLIAACADSPSGGGAAAPDSFGIVQRFPNLNLFTPGEVRLPISITDGQTVMVEGPDVLTGWIETFDGERVAEVRAPRRDDGIVLPYWEVRAVLDRPAIHTLRLEGDDGYGATFELWDPADVRTPLTGAPLPPLETPTVDDPRGVIPYCSLTPEPCPLHAQTLAEALQQGTPVAFIVGTPAHCQTGTCGPGLELLVAEHDRLGDRVAMVHADVFADAAATVTAPVVEALALDYEPVIYFADATGTIVDRLDGVWDAGELRERLDLLVA